MATPNDRQVIFQTMAESHASYTVLSSLETSEEGVVHGRDAHEEWASTEALINYNVNGGGKIDLATAQGNDAWTSMIHPKVYWDMLDDTAFFFGNKWEDMHKTWDGYKIIEYSATGEVLRPPPAIGFSNIEFIYIKNVGDQTAELSLDTGNQFSIIIPPGAAVSIHVDGTAVSGDHVRVRAILGQTTTVEYVIAQI